MCIFGYISVYHCVCVCVPEYVWLCMCIKKRKICMTVYVYEERKVKVKAAQLCLTLCDPLDYTGPWYSPGQNTGVVSLSLLQGIFPTQGSNPGLLHCRRILDQLRHQGSSEVEEFLLNCQLITINSKWCNNGMIHFEYTYEENVSAYISMQKYMI